MPTARLFVLLAIGTVLIAGSAVVPWLGPAGVVVDLLALAAWSIDLLRARKASLEARRTLPPMLTQDASAEVVVALVGAARRRCTVRLRDSLHPGLAAAPERFETTLEPGRETVWRYTVQPRRRGSHAGGPLVARVRGPWGLAWSQRTLLAGEPWRVYPQVRWDGRVGQLLVLAHRRALGLNPQRFRGMGSELYALRGYLPGDPMNKIHWKASARHGRLVSREDTWERGARLIVLLDCGRGMSGRIGRRDKLDHALAASLALGRVAAARGDQVTLIAFADRVLHSVRMHGTRGVHAAYGALYDLVARPVESAFDLAAARAAVVESRRSTVMVLTSVVDLASAEMLRVSLLELERRHHPILVNLEEPALRDLAYDAPATSPDAFAKAAALDSLLGNQALTSQLRHAGVRAVTTSADRLALEALEAYLAMFGRRAA